MVPPAIMNGMKSEMDGDNEIGTNNQFSCTTLIKDSDADAIEEHDVRNTRLVQASLHLSFPTPTRTDDTEDERIATAQGFEYLDDSAEDSIE